MWHYLWWFTLICSSCLKQADRSHSESSYLPKNKSEKIPVQVSKPAFYIAQQQLNTIINPSDLKIIRASVLLVNLGGQKIGRVQTFADPEADFVRWNLCPNKGERACIENRSFLREIFLGGLDPGSYTLVLRACVRPDKTKDQKEECGPLYSLDFQQPSYTDDKKKEIISELMQKENKLKELGEKLYLILEDFSLDLKKCKLFANNHNKNFGKEKIKEYDQLKQIIQIQLENIKNLGSDFVSYSLQGVSEVKTDDQIISAAGITSDLVPLSNQDPFASSSYIPSGFSLTNQDFFNTTVDAYQGGDLIIDQKNKNNSLKGSLGDAGSLSPDSYWSGLSDWKKATIAASCLMGGAGALAGFETASDWAGFRLVAGFLNIKRDDYPCFAFEKAIDALEPLKKDIFETKKRMTELENKIK